MKYFNNVCMQESTFFSPKCQILSFAGHTVSMTTTELCCCSMKAGTDKTQMNGCSFVPTTRYLQKQAAGQIWHRP